MSSSLPRFLAVLSLLAGPLVVGTGCASQPEYPSISGTSSRSPIRVTVENRMWLDVGVYALRGSSRFRVGTVRALSEASFTLPSGATNASGQLRLLADPVGSSRMYTTHEMPVYPGARVYWTVHESQAISSAIIRQ